MCARGPGPPDPKVAGRLLCLFGLSIAFTDGNFFDVNDVRMSRRRGRKTGMHWTMIVPTISDEYQIFECALRQKYHASFTFPSSFQLVRTAETIATIIPYNSVSRRSMSMQFMSPTRLIVTQSPIFSDLRMSKFQVKTHGNAASTKSMIMLYTTQDISDGCSPFSCVEAHHCHLL
jgi:hypothetical protein